MPTPNNEDKDFPNAQDSGALPDNTADADNTDDIPEENLSEVAMRISVLGKLVIPPPTP